MSIRPVAGKWHFRFTVSGREYTGSCGLLATEGNREKALQKEARARALVEAGQADSLKIKARRFSDAMDAFLGWAEGEHRAHPNTYLRLKGSSASLLDFFGSTAVHLIRPGQIEDFKTWRRAAREVDGETVKGVKEVTIRHDLHALSSFFRYARKQRWLVGNPLEDVDIPSDKDAVRIHPLSDAEEKLYFSTAQARKLWDLHDLGRLMLNQGCRPEEFLELRWDAVDLEAGTMRVVDGKSTAAKRTLRLTQESREILSRRFQGAHQHPPHGKSSLRAPGTAVGVSTQRANPSVWVFPSPKKPGAHVVSLQKAHEAVLAKTGLSFVVYDFRHSFATRMAARGCPLPKLAAILGHANLRSIMKYVHMGAGDIAEAMAEYGEPVPAVEQISPVQPGRVQ